MDIIATYKYTPPFFNGGAVRGYSTGQTYVPVRRVRVKNNIDRSYPLPIFTDIENLSLNLSALPKFHLLTPKSI
jgi:hypothetical protein